jgi:hypothetical protein
MAQNGHRHRLARPGRKPSPEARAGQREYFMRLRRMRGA